MKNDKRETYYFRHRLARLGDLGTLAFCMVPEVYQWFLLEVYDLRFPHIGDNRHEMNGRRFDSLRNGGRHWRRLEDQRYRARGRWMLARRTA